MPRLPRFNIPGLVYHVTNRGIQRLPIFQHDEDRFEFIDWIKEAKNRYGLEIEQHCLMTNHYHLLIRLLGESLSMAMKFAMSRYARWFNRKYGHSGHLFQDRFHSLPVQEDRYYITVCRYIHLNPVHAGMVARPEDHAWSNYASLMRQERDMVSTGGSILDYFPGDTKRQLAGYQRFVEENMNKPEPITTKVLLRMRSWGALPKIAPSPILR